MGGKTGKPNHETSKDLFFVKPAVWEGGTSQEAVRRDLDSAVGHEPNATGLCCVVLVKQVQGINTVLPGRYEEQSDQC